MNLVTQQLAEQAAEEVIHESFEIMMITESEEGPVLQVPAVFIEKFAELIITEASKFTDHAEELYSHFGIE